MAFGDPVADIGGYGPGFGGGGLLDNFSGLPDEDYDPVYDFSLFQPATDTTPRIGNVQNRVGTLMSHPDLSMIDYGMDANTTVPRDAFELLGNMDLQHEIAAHHLNSLVEGYRGLPRDVQSNLRSSARHALGVQSVGKPLMDAYEFGSNIHRGSTGQPEDYAANERAAEALAINPDISTQALIGQVALGTDSPIGLESAETPSTRNIVNPYAQGFPLTNEQVQNLDNQVYNLDNAYAQLDLQPFYNYVDEKVGQVLDLDPVLAVETGKNYVLNNLGLPYFGTIKSGLDKVVEGMELDNPEFGINIPGRAQDDVFEPSMDLQMEFGPVMDSDLPGVEGLMEAGGVLGGGSGVIGPDFDQGAVSGAGGEALQEALAQRVAETMIAQQAARAPSNNVTIPMSSGPDIVIDVTPPAPQTSVAPQRRTAPRPSPVKIAAKSVAKPKAFKALPKFAQKEIRQGKVPTGGSDYIQDMVSAFLAPAPKPIPKAGSTAWHNAGYGR
jgi:hypothetical protein